MKARYRLYTYYRNSAGERVRIALALKGIAYDYISAPALPRDKWHAINPQGLMPALAIGDAVIAQSAAILEYLEEQHPEPPLLPADPVLRAKVRAFAQAIACDLHPLNNYRVRRYLARNLAADDGAILDWYRHWVSETLAPLEVTLGEIPGPPRFCFSAKPGWAEAHLVPQLWNAARFGCDLSPYPRLRAVGEACEQLPAFQTARPEAQPDYPGTLRTTIRPRGLRT